MVEQVTPARIFTDGSKLDEKIALAIRGGRMI